MFRQTPLLFHRRARLTTLSASPFLASFFTKEQPVEAPKTLPTQIKPSENTYAGYGSQTQRAAQRNRFALYRQISLGSILGLTAGLVLSKFSHVLAFGAGIVITIVQLFAMKGIHVIPYAWVGDRMRSGLRNSMEKNAGFKISFALAMSLTAFVRDY